MFYTGLAGMCSDPSNHACASLCSSKFGAAANGFDDAADILAEHMVLTSPDSRLLQAPGQCSKRSKEKVHIF